MIVHVDKWLNDDLIIGLTLCSIVMGQLLFFIF